MLLMDSVWKDTQSELQHEHDLNEQGIVLSLSPFSP